MGNASSRPEPSTQLASLPGGEVEYRLDRRGEPTVVVLHGGHMRASIRLGEDDFEELGYTVLAPSRPGYGSTPLAAGASPVEFADTVRNLCDHLDITVLDAAVGISAGGPTAVALAARHPLLVRRLVLESAVGPLPWPSRRERVAGKVAFNPVTEGATWALVRSLLRGAPTAGLRAMLGGLSTQPTRALLASFDTAERRKLTTLFSQMRSGRGFGNDLEHLSRPTNTPADVRQPTLVVASRCDGSVPFEHAEALAEHLPNATLAVSEAASHLIWFGPGQHSTSDALRRFLALG
jgi:pimeloyl-ACP methyl ester carboxylesterase